MKHYKVYQYTFPDGMIYIGTTSKSLQERRDCGYNHNARLKEVIRSCGWRNIEKKILAECATQEEAFAEDVNGHKANISRACADGRQYKGFAWRFAEERG